MRLYAQAESSGARLLASGIISDGEFIRSLPSSSPSKHPAKQVTDTERRGNYRTAVIGSAFKGNEATLARRRANRLSLLVRGLRLLISRARYAVQGNTETVIGWDGASSAEMSLEPRRALDFDRRTRRASA